MESLIYYYQSLSPLDIGLTFLFISQADPDPLAAASKTALARFETKLPFYHSSARGIIY